MNVLISEDRLEKYGDIRRTILELFPDAKISKAMTVVDTLRKLERKDFDLHIQDMQLPMHPDGRIDTKGGLEVLFHLHFDSKNDDMVSIVCSSDYDTRKILDESGIDGTLFVHYNTFSNDWSDKLKEMIKNNVKVV